MEIRSADSILSKFLSEKHDTLRLLSNDPERFVSVMWTAAGPLAIDRGCMWRPGSPGSYHETPRGVRKFHACEHCQYLDHLVDLGKVPIGTPFVIEAGSAKGKELVLESELAGQLSIKLTSGPPMMAQMAHRKTVGKMTTTYPDIYLESDRFTNSVLISWVVEIILANMPGVEKIYIAFICSDRGYTLRESTLPLMNVPMTDSSAVRGILHQLTNYLSVLSERSFIHGNPCLSSLRFQIEPVEYTYKSVQVKSPVVLKLSDFRTSSLTIQLPNDRKLRLLPKHDMPNRYAESLSSLSGSKGNTYVLTKSATAAYQHLHSLGVPICPSLETYCFILALVTSDTNFYELLLDDDKSAKAFEAIWSPDQVDEVHSRIQIIRDAKLGELNVSDLLGILQGCVLREDVLDILSKALEGN